LPSSLLDAVDARRRLVSFGFLGVAGALFKIGVLRQCSSAPALRLRADVADGRSSARRET
jgi:hypothetical protein